MINEPHAVGRTTKNEARPVHIAGANRQQHRLAVSTADLESERRLRRQVNIMPLHFLQTLLSDAVEKSHGRAMVQSLRRGQRCVLQINLKRMPLAGADAQAVFAEGKTLLVARGNDVLELVESQGNTLAIHGLQ